MGDDARVAEIEKTVDRKDLEKANELNEGLRATDRAEYEVSQREIEKVSVMRFKMMRSLMSC